MANGKGFQGIVGVIKGSTWGTAVECNAGEGIEVESITETDGGLQIIPDNQITGKVTAKQGSAGNIQAGVQLVTALRYEGLEPLIAFFMGTAGAPSTVDTSAKQHVLKPKDDVDGIFSTVAYEYIKDTAVAEFPSVKWNRLRLSAQAGQRVMLEMSGIADTWKNDSSVNTTTTIDTITLPSNREYATFRQCAFKMNAQSGGSLAAVPIYVEGFELVLERPMDRIYTTERGHLTSEPKPSGWMTGSLTCNFAQIADGTGGNHAFVADQLAATAQKAKIEITSTTLAGASTQYFQHLIWLPYVQFTPQAKPGIPGPGKIAWQQSATLHHVGSIPTGFTSGYTDMVTWDIFSQRSTDALA